MLARSSVIAALAACLGLGLACGGSGSTGSDAGSPGGGFDCALVNGSNCGKTTVAAAASCLPPSTAKGTLSADGKTCTYASGTVIDFTPPVVIGPGANVTGFTLTTGGSQCLQYHSSTGGAVFTTSAGTVSLAVTPDRQTLTLTCPNGTAYSGPVAALSACANMLPGIGIGTGSISTGDGGYSVGLSVTLGGTGNSTDPKVFDCVSP